MATQKNKILVCETCGNVVELMQDNGPAIECCGQEMGALVENTTDAAQEKHVPVVEAVTGGYRVSVGEVAHPMEDKHYIQWIELEVDGIVSRKYLQGGDEPVVFFPMTGNDASARAFCNLHGLWKG